MSKDYESLLEYKKSTKDWHYNPSVPSIDYQYVGRFVDLTFDENELLILCEEISTLSAKTASTNHKDTTTIQNNRKPIQTCL